MAAEKNCQYLLLLVDSRICGIDLTKLIKPKEEEEEAVDWENQPLPPFDLSINLPREYMHVLELDSKIVVLGGYKFRYECNGKLNGNQAGAMACYKFYEVDLDKEEVVESTIKDSEKSVNSFRDQIIKIGSNYYFIVMNGIAPMGCHYNFNRLHSGTKAWECLPSVPDDPFTYFDDIDEYSSPVKGFLLFHFYGMLYIRMRLEDGKVYILTYDTNQPLVDWTMIEGDNDFTRSFCVTVAAQPLFLPPAVRIPDFFCPDKYLALSCIRIGGEYVIYAFLVDRSGVFIFQRLENCFDKLPSYFIHEKAPHLVDFDGKGTIGFLLHGFIKVKENPALCVLVLQVAKRVLDNPTQILGRSESSPTQCKFLDSKVLATNMYSMKGINIWSPLFVFPNSQCLEENAQEDPVLGKRKWSKLI